ncbi:methylmalonyl-CoA mutase family protein [Longimicrobium sp.]|jgi:methylmalonyl-CoA mutase N-terminal domain/subunit|uniref:acyl-CoA mutase large subunit family protein n=1 Tax=Longimicrobium sp. TaxID=2029185 RepID=UPI002F93E026
MSTVEHNVSPDLVRALDEKDREIERLKADLAAWEGAYERTGARDASFTTVSGVEVEPLYTPLDRPRPAPEEAAYYAERIGLPGEYPFTRGPYGTMYRTRLWTMRQFAGFGTAEETNERYHFLLKRGQTGLSVAFDFPTLMGYDSDHPRSLGEVGKCGVAISSLDDMETLFDGIPLDKVSVSMTINGPAIILFCFYVVAAERQGVSFSQLRGTVQNDILKEYQAQHAWVYPPEPALRLIEDMFEWASKEAPKYNPISISGYHIREAGSTAVQELAYTLKNGLEYVRRGVERGLDVDDFAPRLSFFWDVHNDFFEEIAKFRAARRIWARHLRDEFGAKNPESWRLRTHAQTAGVTLTAQQPENNIVRVAYQAMAAVLGGTQSLHTNSMDETLALPTERAVQVALRTQQILAYETGVPNTIDPLAGSYYVEALTDQMEAEAERIFAEIDKLGGVVPGIEVGYFQREIARSAFRQQLEIERGERTIVGVNDFTVEGEELQIPLLKITEEAELRQRERMAAMRQRRDQAQVDAALEHLKQVARTTENVVPAMLDAVRAYATLYEIRAAMEEVFGAYQEPVFF